jgi:hypothetical protein
MNVGNNAGNVEGHRAVKLQENTVEEAIKNLYTKCDNMNGIAHSIEGLQRRVCGNIYKEDDIKDDRTHEPSGLVEKLERISFILEETLNRMRVSTCSIDNALGE